MTPSTTSPTPPPAPPNILPFPNLLTNLFTPFDTHLLHLLQHPTLLTNPLTYPLAFLLTSLTAIETSLPMPLILYTLHNPTTANKLTTTLITLCLLTQLPKKFIWRPRPWMIGAAKGLRRDKTSSFPSRAVVCAVVYSRFLFGDGFWGWVGGGLLVVGTAWARCFVGAHWPSDCLIGGVVGWVVVSVGSWVEGLLDGGCCGGLRWWGRAVVGVGVSYAVTLVSMCGFWVKCAYVYGLLFAAATFRFVWLCEGGLDLGRRAVLSWGEFAVMAGGFGCLLAFGMATRGLKSVGVKIGVFSVVYWGSLGLVLYWRMFGGSVIDVVPP